MAGDGPGQPLCVTKRLFRTESRVFGHVGFYDLSLVVEKYDGFLRCGFDGVKYVLHKISPQPQHQKRIWLAVFKAVHLVHEKYLPAVSQEHQIALERLVAREPLLQPAIRICEKRTGALRDEGLVPAEVVKLYRVYVPVYADGLVEPGYELQLGAVVELVSL